MALADGSGLAHGNRITARALVQTLQAMHDDFEMWPEFLALDEPAAGLDPRGRREVINLLAGLDQTILAATHDLAMAAEIFPRMIIMDEGCVVFDGETEFALKDKKLMSRHGLAG